MARRNWPRYRLDRDAWVTKIDGKLVTLGRDRDVAMQKFKLIMCRLGREVVPPRLEPIPILPKPKLDDEGWRQIYFIRNTANGCIKIGQSRDVRERFRALQLANADPLELLGFVVAQAAYEELLHRKFHRFRIRGEWFRGDPELLAAIDVLLMKSES